MNALAKCPVCTALHCALLCPVLPVHNYQPKLRNTPEEQWSQLHGRKSLKCRVNLFSPEGQAGDFWEHSDMR